MQMLQLMSNRTKVLPQKILVDDEFWAELSRFSWHRSDPMVPSVPRRVVHCPGKTWMLYLNRLVWWMSMQEAAGIAPAVIPTLNLVLFRTLQTLPPLWFLDGDHYNCQRGNIGIRGMRSDVKCHGSDNLSLELPQGIAPSESVHSESVHSKSTPSESTHKNPHVRQVPSVTTEEIAKLLRGANGVKEED